MTFRNILLAGTIVAGPLLSLIVPGAAAQAQSDPSIRLAQAEPAPGERRERAAPPQAQPQPREAPAQREAPPAREAPQQREAPRAAPPAPAPAPQREAPRAEPPRERSQAAPERREAAPERREAAPERPQAAPERRDAAPERREPPRAEPPRDRPQAPPAAERNEPPRPVTPPATARPDAPPRPATPPTPPSATQSRPEAAPPRPEPGQRPTPPAVPPSATQSRPDLGGRPDAAPQARPGDPNAAQTATPPAQRSTAPSPQGLAPLAPPQPRDDQRQGDRQQDRDRGQLNDRDRGQPGDRRVEERDGRTYIRENDNRLIIREGGRDIVRHDEVERLRRGARDVDVQQRPNGRREIVVVRPDGDRIVTIVDVDGNLLRRERRARDGRSYVLIDNDRDRPRDGFYRPVELPPLRLDIPRERYIVEAEDAPYNVIEDTLMAAPVERVERPYSLDEVRYNQRLREKVRRVDIDSINFEFGSADVDQNGAARLESIARALREAVAKSPNEVFLVEGHTDAVGGDTENLTLSDRRAESVAGILSERYQIPPENLVTQGYGEQFLKVQTQAAERQNRRVTVRRITPLLQQGQNQAAPR